MNQVSGLHRASRRAFLQGVASGACVLTLPFHAAFSAEEARSLSFMHTHTGERLSVVYWRAGVYQDNKLAQVNRFLRDFRTGEIHAMDPQLLDILHSLQTLAARDAVYEVISAYRSPHTNERLRNSTSGVSEHSQHMEGRAIDVRMTGFSTRTLHKLALSLKRGGVGFYPKSDFVHIDTGRIRFWEG